MPRLTQPRIVEPMELTVLGCRSGMPADGQASSGYLVEAGGVRILLDCGPGVTTVLSGVLAPQRLDAVVISHLHSDHCYDLLPLGKVLLHGRLGPDGFDDTTPGTPLYVPAGARSVLDRLAALFPVSTFPMLDRAFEIAFDVREYDPGSVFDIAGCRVSLHLLRHAAPNCGVRIESPTGSLAYTGDTGPTAGLDALARGVDMLLAESTLTVPDIGSHGHLCAADAGAAAAAAGVGELVLTHFGTADPAALDARRAAAAAVYDGPIGIAAPLRRFPVLSPSGTHHRRS